MRVEDQRELIGFGHERSSSSMPSRTTVRIFSNPGGSEFRLESPALQSLQPPQTGGVVMRLALIEHEAIEHGGRNRAQLEHIGGPWPQSCSTSSSSRGAGSIRPMIS